MPEQDIEMNDNEDEEVNLNANPFTPASNAGNAPEENKNEEIRHRNLRKNTSSKMGLAITIVNSRTATSRGGPASSWSTAFNPSESKLGNQECTLAITTLATRAITIPPIIASLYGDSATFLFSQFINKGSF